MAIIRDSQALAENVPVSNVFFLSEIQMKRIATYFHLAHGVLRMDDRYMLSKFIYPFPRNVIQSMDSRQ
ncbi:hypothetical protein DY926_04200 [Komagataeibacter melaceti]|uniref:Uncharacterized protein n=1 Tax=Komagataeibacter melaceti TaxID=2766577 RepID=A0A371Z2Y4_9PROT|nr:hypothetical protein DY926_04200 [Komagataeibacter melaceti]